MTAAQEARRAVASRRDAPNIGRDRWARVAPKVKKQEAVYEPDPFEQRL